jgi:transcription termination factor Rho
MAQQQAIHKFALGQKEVEGKPAEFWYDKGWYSIVEIEGEERNVIYRSRNAQEAYMKWNVYIGRKKERPVPDERRRSEGSDSGSRRDSRFRQENRDRGERAGRSDRNNRGERNERSDRQQESGENREGRRRRPRDGRREGRRQQREDRPKEE